MPQLNFVKSGQGPTVVLSHALGCDLSLWDEVATLLAPRYTVLRYDHRGHGASAPVPGPCTVEDLADDAAALIAAEVVTPANILEAILRGPLSDRLYDLVQRQVERMVDEQAGLFGRFVALTAGTKQYEAMKQLIADRVVENLPATLRHVERYAGEAMDLRNTLITKMQELSEEEFEALLRPAFQQDEWILITVGAVLGFLVGELQLFIMLHH